jgi:hypothetical protein
VLNQLHVPSSGRRARVLFPCEISFVISAPSRRVMLHELYLCHYTGQGREVGALFAPDVGFDQPLFPLLVLRRSAYNTLVRWRVSGSGHITFFSHLLDLLTHNARWWDWSIAVHFCGTTGDECGVVEIKVRAGRYNRRGRSSKPVRSQTTLDQ